ncbi:MAG: hypothetical protein ACUVTZ_12235 [Armatimonadota bacterium]
MLGGPLFGGDKVASIAGQGDPRTTLDRLIEHAAGHAGGELRDDVAVLLIQRSIGARHDTGS